MIIDGSAGQARGLSSLGIFSFKSLRIRHLPVVFKFFLIDLDDYCTQPDSEGHWHWQTLFSLENRSY
jgi:hypothetical protein